MEIKTGIDRKTIEIQIEAFKKNLNSPYESRLERKEAEAFDVGSSMIWAAIFSISAIDDEQFASDASLAAQRFGLINEAVNMHRSELIGTQVWYYDAGVILPYITLWVNSRDGNLVLEV